ncbi:hypothetical protein [Bacillus cereus group sp. BfR-BA-01379]|uniref:hypothetical protein n=1 Tax=Bacillus cereus group sp. BfR-BA-01379 TaxID=2920323 RepID=UPI001F55E7FA|nr:hypothetical protein [Bacillus cereus group sp. BfR-BA-01379]
MKIMDKVATLMIIIAFIIIFINKEFSIIALPLIEVALILYSIIAYKYFSNAYMKKFILISFVVISLGLFWALLVSI